MQQRRDGSCGLEWSKERRFAATTESPGDYAEMTTLIRLALLEIGVAMSIGVAAQSAWIELEPEAGHVQFVAPEFGSASVKRSRRSTDRLDVEAVVYRGENVQAEFLFAQYKKRALKSWELVEIENLRDLRRVWNFFKKRRLKGGRKGKAQAPFGAITYTRFQIRENPAASCFWLSRGLACYLHPSGCASQAMSHEQWLSMRLESLDGEGGSIAGYVCRAGEDDYTDEEIAGLIGHLQVNREAGVQSGVPPGEMRTGGSSAITK